MTRPSRFSPEVQERAVRMVLEHGEQYWAPYGVGHTKARTGHQAYGRGQTGPPSIYPAELVPAPRRISYALDATRNAPQTGAGRTLGVSEASPSPLECSRHPPGENREGALLTGSRRIGGPPAT